MRYSLIATALAFSAVCTAAAAQDFIPINPDSLANTAARLGAISIDREGVADLAEIEGDVAESATPQTQGALTCTRIPTDAEVGTNFTMRQSVLTRSAATELGIPVASVSATGDEVVLVQDYLSVKDCLATDGRTMLQYGRGIRTIITMTSVRAETNPTLPMIAAAATLSARRNQIRIEVYGFSNNAMTTTAASIFGKELNVETYAEFASVHKRLVDLTTDRATTRSVVRLGVLPDGERASLANATIIGWALHQLSQGNSCNSAKSSLPSVQASEPQPDRTNIESTYIQLTGSCNADQPSQLQRAAAREYLYGLKVVR